MLRGKVGLLRYLLRSIVFVNLAILAASFTQVNSLFQRFRLIVPLGYVLLCSTALLPLILGCEITAWFSTKKREPFPSYQSLGAGRIWIDVFVVLIWIVMVFFLAARGIASWMSI
jgi:hypothetical protein